MNDLIYKLKKDPKMNNNINEIFKNILNLDVLLNMINSWNAYIVWWYLRSFYEWKIFKDIDIFFTEKKQFNIIKDILKEYKIKLNWENYFNVDINWINIDFTYMDYTNDIIWVLDNSDFTIWSIWYTQGVVIYYKTFFQDLMNKILIYKWTMNPYLSIERVSKFKNYWFNIDKENLNKLILDKKICDNIN